MGYYTTFNLKWQKHGKFKDKPNCNHTIQAGAKYCPDCGTPVGFIGMDKQIGEFLELHKEDMYGIDSGSGQTEAVKWYDHEAHMIEMSKAFPSVLFTLAGEGEESGDIWSKYFLNGKIQVAKARIESDPFDESKLKSYPDKIIT